ncbi:hypothetical protein MVES1_000234 [Malassezia vespertilionis]|uniref:uncharacterized protein n=1 Tax=Malassezia vespertilionis TaxID=2020962 RepID=UPI0024B280D9|nr:uncharacterized protein MVES1_000234 [Malassezia vespertilionis]WFD04909.1 hypothetical protein MVES1_000234 [Malassezia vespertilionis]
MVPVPHILRGISNVRITRIFASASSEHVLFLSEDGEVYVYGKNTAGQCGIDTKTDRFLSEPRKLDRIRDFVPPLAEGETITIGAAGGDHSLLVTTNGTLIVSVSAGISFSVLATAKGQVACGQAHSVALDKEGYVYTWGEGSFGRLGCGTQRNQPIPVKVQQFAQLPKQDRVRTVYAGSASTVCIDQHGAFWAAGRVRRMGDGGPGQAFSIFKPLAPLEDVQCIEASVGQDVFQCLAAEREKDNAQHLYSWGEGVSHGELGLVKRPPPMPCVSKAMDGISIRHVQSGRFLSLFLVEPNQRYADLPRIPQHVVSSDVCLVCHQGGAEDASTLLECDRCENPFHLSCLQPPLESIPEGEWFCETCGGMKQGAFNDGVRKKRRRAF